MERKKRKIYTPEDYYERFDYGTFRQRMLALMKEAGTTQTALADELCVDKGTMNRWMTGKGKDPVRYEHIHELAKRFRVDPEYLYDKDAVRSQSEAIEKWLDAEESKAWEKNKELVAYLNSLGYDVEFDPNTRKLYILDTNHFPPQNILLDDTMIERIKLAVQDTILS